MRTDTLLRNRRHSLPALLLLAVSTTATAQMSGTYTVDPNGSGNRNFTTLTQAALALINQGVNGAVTVEIASGTYQESWGLYPVQGTSSSNTITFKSKVPLGARLGGDSQSAYIVALDGGAGTLDWIVFDGIEFFTTRGQTTNGYIEQRAVQSNRSVQNIEIRNCRFQATSVYVRGEDQADEWRVHHNVFEGDFDANCVYFHRTHAVHVYNNQIQMRKSTRGIYKITTPANTTKRSRIYNNGVVGSLRGQGIAVWVDYSTDIDHNTVDVQGQVPAVVYILGAQGRSVALRNNIIVNTSAGSALFVTTMQGPEWIADSNIYHTTDLPRGIISTVVNSKPVRFTNLLTWQQASGQDANSHFGDPKLVGGITLPDRLKLQDGSPAEAAAHGTASWVKTDLLDTKRWAPAAIGAIEGPPTASFSTFGKGCPGTFNNVPAIGMSGDLRLGSTNFNVTLKNALGNANTVFAIGLSNAKLGSINLPFDFGGGCSLLTSSELTFWLRTGGLGPGNGTANVKFRIPNKPALQGVRVHFQWGVVDPVARGIGLAMSDGGTFTF